jgi:hypothetical protein
MTAKKLTILISALLITAGQSEPCIAGLRRKPKPLREGFVIAGLDGELVRAGEQGEWFVKFDKPIADDKGRIEAGQYIELLPASTLEKIAAAVKEDSAFGIRLWGRVTRYENRNFIFPTYFLPLAQDRPKSATADKKASPAKPTKPNINEPGDTIILPDEVLQRLRPRRLVSLAQLKMGLESQEDSILVERAGFILKPDNSPYFIFQLDALGRNIEAISFRLLPSEELEGVNITQAGGIVRSRYKVTGILTKYKGQYYLLPQRVRRFYNYENFG